MRYLLDTNICIYIMNHRPPEVQRRFAWLKLGDLGISVITYHELCFGMIKSQNSVKNLERLAQFVEDVGVIEFSETAAAIAADIRLGLEQAGTPIGSYDLLIAAHTLSLNLTLVTNNLREFSRVPKLKLDNWLETA